MQAIVKTKCGYGLALQDVPVPPVGPDEVRVEVRAAAICGSDLKVFKWEPQVVQRYQRLRNMTLPHVIGHEVAGIVSETGTEVRGVKVGDRVAAETHLACGRCVLCRTGRMHVCDQRKILGFDTPGAFARSVVLPAHCAVPLPANVSFEVGALCESFGVAVHAVELARTAEARSAWVIGCGPIGLFIVKLLVTLKMETILATDVHPQRLRWAEKFGAKAIPAQENIGQLIREITGKQGADLVFEVAGSSETVRQALAGVAPCGRVLLVGTFGGATPIDVASDLVYHEVNVQGVYGRHMFDTWRSVSQILSDSKIDLLPFITHRFPFSRVQEAFETTLGGDGIKTVLFPDEV